MFVNDMKLAEQFRRCRSRVACLWLVIALTLLIPTSAFAQWGEQPPPQLLVEFRIAMVPDQEAQGAGAVPLANRIGMAGRIWQDNFTGSGCIYGPFEPSVIDLWTPSNGEQYRFEVTCKSRSNEDKVSLIEWKGELRDGKISGDVWIALPGNPLTAEQVVSRKQADRDEAKRKVPAVTINGRVFNEAVIEAAARETDRRNALLPAQGRRLHFTFTTTDVVIIPVGSWAERKQPATRPSAGSPANREAVRP